MRRAESLERWRQGYKMPEIIKFDGRNGTIKGPIIAAGRAEFLSIAQNQRSLFDLAQPIGDGLEMADADNRIYLTIGPVLNLAGHPPRTK